MWSLLFQVSFLHQPDHKPGSSAQAGDGAWRQGAGRRGRCKALCLRAAVWLAGLGLSLKCPGSQAHTSCPCEVWYAGWLLALGGRGGAEVKVGGGVWKEPSKSLLTNSVYEALPSALAPLSWGSSNFGQRRHLSSPSGTSSVSQR